MAAVTVAAWDKANAKVGTQGSGSCSQGAADVGTTSGARDGEAVIGAIASDEPGIGTDAVEHAHWEACNQQQCAQQSDTQVSTQPRGLAVYVKATWVM